MIHSRELPKQIPTQQSRVQVSKRHPPVHLGTRYWSPTVAAGFLALVILMAVTVVVALLAAFRP